MRKLRDPLAPCTPAAGRPRARKPGLVSWLRTHVSPALVQLGFAEVPVETGLRGWALRFIRSQGIATVQVEFLRNAKFSASQPDRGSEFWLTIRFVEPPLRFENHWYLLTPEEREEFRSIQNRVLSAMGAVTRDRPYPSNVEVLMRYRDESDIALWSGFLSQHLSSVVQRFLAGPRGAA